MTCYVADVESGLIRYEIGKKFYAMKKITFRTEPAPGFAIAAGKNLGDCRYASTWDR